MMVRIRVMNKFIYQIRYGYKDYNFRSIIYRNIIYYENEVTFSKENL